MNNSEENKLTHSAPAISITHEFYNTQVMVYVEGDDDIPFWDELFKKKVPEGFYTIEQVGGKNNLRNRINAIKKGDITNVIVACDSDYNRILYDNTSTLYNNPLIIMTHGHSIENTMFCPRTVAKYIKNVLKTTTDYYPSTKTWYEQFCSLSIKLLPYDILNQEEFENNDDSSKKKVYNERFYRLQDDSDPTMLSENKIEVLISRIKSNYKESDVIDIENRIALDSREPRYIIQGHFLEIAVMNYIRETIKKAKKVALSNEAIFTSFIDCNTQCNSICNDRQILFQQIEKAYQYYNPTI